ncbi:MAG: HAD-IIIA family hydrolase [Azospirillum sp.]|nr:HAD-IIIA family hydrolase [Azospirillum sp.]
MADTVCTLPAPPAAAHSGTCRSLTDDNIWFEIGPAAARLGQPRPALLLDRDGVIVEEVNYLHRVEDVRLLDGAAALIALANRQGVPVVVVTNQAGIARGYFDWAELIAVQDRIGACLAACGAAVDLTIACPHHPEGKSPFAHPDHPMRKPNPGMIDAAASLLNLDLRRSLLIGDTVSDLCAGLAAGVGAVAHVLTGHGRRERAAALRLNAGGRIHYLNDLQQGGPLLASADPFHT